MKVVVLGGGIIGLTTTYYLSKNGFNVSVYDKSSILDSTSCRNAGYICPSMYVPLTLSLSMKNVFKWVFERKYGVSLRPTLKNLRWLYKVYRYRDRVDFKTIDIFLHEVDYSLKDFSEIVKRLDDVEYRVEPAYEVYLDESDFREALEIYNSISYFRRNVSKADTGELDLTMLKYDVAGVIKHNKIHIVEPLKYIKSLSNALKSDGVDIVEGVNLRIYSNGDIYLNNSRIKYDILVLSAGVWTRELLNYLGYDISLVPAKGYRVLYKDTIFDKCVFIDDLKTAFTYYRDYQSITFGFKITTYDDGIESNILNNFMHELRKLFKGFNPSNMIKVEYGYRPCSPDEMPIIDRVRLGDKQIIIATGHCRFGLTFSTYTAREVYRMVLDDEYTPKYRSIEGISKSV